MPLSEYEQQQLDALRDWLATPPGMVARGFGRSTRPLVQMAKPLLPEALLRKSFAAASELGQRTAWSRQILEQTGKEQLQDIQVLALEDCDALWRGQRKRMMVMAAGEGALTGLGGAAGWALDVPALLVLALQGVYRTVCCFGYEPQSENLNMAVLGLAAANTQAERLAAWQLAVASEVAAEDLRDGLEQALRPAFAKQAVAMSLTQLAQQMSLNLGRRKALGMVPLAGALVGGSVNAWYLKDVMQASRYVCHGLRLHAQMIADQG